MKIIAIIITYLLTFLIPNAEKLSETSLYFTGVGAIFSSQAELEFFVR